VSVCAGVCGCRCVWVSVFEGVCVQVRVCVCVQVCVVSRCAWEMRIHADSFCLDMHFRALGGNDYALKWIYTDTPGRSVRADVYVTMASKRFFCLTYMQP